MSASMRASSRNHNHTRTALQGRSPAPRSSSRAPHTTHRNNTTAHRLDMHTPQTPPAEERSPRAAPLNGSAPSEHPATPSANSPPTPAPSKFSVSPSAPSFAAIVSASPASRGAAKSPLAAHAQKHEHAHAQVQSLAADAQPPLEHTSTRPIGENGASASGDTSPSAGVAEVRSSHTQPPSPAARCPPENPAVPKAVTGDDDPAHENDGEDSESSDVEIYLTTLGLHDSAARMHVFGGPGKRFISLLFPPCRGPMNAPCMHGRVKAVDTLRSIPAWVCAHSLFPPAIVHSSRVLAAPRPFFCFASIIIAFLRI